MKRRIIPIIVVLLALSGSLLSVNAQPIGSSNRGDSYLVTAQDLSKWCFGLYGGARERDVSVEGRFLDTSLKTEHGMLYGGYRALPWLMPYVTVGLNWAEIGNEGFGNEELEYGVGVHANLVDHEIYDPTLFEDRIRLTASAGFSTTKTESLGRSYEWQELSASLICSVVNDVEGNKVFWPYSLALFAGPLYSDLGGGDVREKDNFGLLAGLEVYLTGRTSFTVAIEQFDEPSFVGGLNVNF